MKRNNNIPQGYKESSLGVIPKEWEVKRIKNIGTVVTGNTPATSDMENYGNEYLFVSPVDLSWNKYIYNTEKKLSSKGFNLSRQIPAGAILFTCIGSTIGKIGVSISSLACNQQINAIICNIGVSNEYLFYELSNRSKRIKLLAGEQAVPIVNKSDFENTRILLPPLPEQQKISEILSTWDKAIEKQTQLIEKLELRKKGLMQQLLTEEKHLHGFSNQWIDTKINKIAKIKKGEQVNKEILSTEEKYPVINGGVTPSGYLDRYNTKANTITISEGGNSCGYVNLMTIPFWSGGHCYTLDVNNGINILFIYQLLKHKEKHIMSLRVGSGLPNIQIKDIGNFKIRIPSNNEQTAIAQVLTAADREIKLAQQKLELLRQQKRGLMQQLLTGKKRVKF